MRLKLIIRYERKLSWLDCMRSMEFVEILKWKLNMKDFDNDGIRSKNMRKRGLLMMFIKSLVFSNDFLIIFGYG